MSNSKSFALEVVERDTSRCLARHFDLIQIRFGDIEAVFPLT